MIKFQLFSFVLFVSFVDPRSGNMQSSPVAR
jgi:hypothetical protein